MTNLPWWTWLVTGVLGRASWDGIKWLWSLRKCRHSWEWRPCAWSRVMGYERWWICRKCGVLGPSTMMPPGSE